MTHYTSIRGWIECPRNRIKDIRDLILSYVERAESYGLKKDVAQLYNQGWHFPEDHINWTYYIFYGADIQTELIDYIKDQIIELTEKIYEVDEGGTDYIVGAFEIEGEDSKRSVIWRTRDGEFKESNYKE